MYMFNRKIFGVYNYIVCTIGIYLYFATKEAYDGYAESM